MTKPTKETIRYSRQLNHTGIIKTSDINSLVKFVIVPGNYSGALLPLFVVEIIFSLLRFWRVNHSEISKKNDNRVTHLYVRVVANDV